MIKIRKNNKYNKGEMHFGLEVLIFIVIIFIIWVLAGGAKNPKEEKPFITPLSDQINPGTKYAPSDVRN